MFGVRLVCKLRSILLMEAYFNLSNNIVGGNIMMKNVRRHGCVPEEIFGGKRRMKQDRSLAKLLFYNIKIQ